VRAYRGWVAAVVLTALAFIGAPDALDTTPATAQTRISAARNQVPGTTASGRVGRLTASRAGIRGPAWGRDPVPGRVADPTVPGQAVRLSAPGRVAGPAAPRRAVRLSAPGRVAGPAAPGRAVDLSAPVHRLLPALPPSPQNHAPVPVRAGAAAALPAAPAALRVARRGRHLTACSPETLQIFRC
jgi:hypothetical protein